MKSLLVLLVLAGGSRVFANPDCFKAEQATYDRVLNDWQGPGEGTRTDVAYAELNLLDAKYFCSEIKQGAYCDLARKAASVYVEGTLDESRTGLRTQRDIIDSQRTARTVELTCRGVPK